MPSGAPAGGVFQRPSALFARSYFQHFVVFRLADPLAHAEAASQGAPTLLGQVFRIRLIGGGRPQFGANTRPPTPAGGAPRTTQKYRPCPKQPMPDACRWRIPSEPLQMMRLSKTMSASTYRVSGSISPPTRSGSVAAPGESRRGAPLPHFPLARCERNDCAPAALAGPGLRSSLTGPSTSSMKTSTSPPLRSTSQPRYSALQNCSEQPPFQFPSISGRKREYPRLGGGIRWW